VTNASIRFVKSPSFLCRQSGGARLPKTSCGYPFFYVPSLHRVLLVPIRPAPPKPLFLPCFDSSIRFHYSPFSIVPGEMSVKSLRSPSFLVYPVVTPFLYPSDYCRLRRSFSFLSENLSFIGVKPTQLAPLPVDPTTRFPSRSAVQTTPVPIRSESFISSIFPPSGFSTGPRYRTEILFLRFLRGLRCYGFPSSFCKDSLLLPPLASWQRLLYR